MKVLLVLKQFSSLFGNHVITRRALSSKTCFEFEIITCICTLKHKKKHMTQWHSKHYNIVQEFTNVQPTKKSTYIINAIRCKQYGDMKTSVSQIFLRIKCSPNKWQPTWDKRISLLLLFKTFSWHLATFQ